MNCNKYSRDVETNIWYWGEKRKPHPLLGRINKGPCKQNLCEGYTVAMSPLFFSQSRLYLRIPSHAIDWCQPAFPGCSDGCFQDRSPPTTLLFFFFQKYFCRRNASIDFVPNLSPHKNNPFLPTYVPTTVETVEYEQEETFAITVGITVVRLSGTLQYAVISCISSLVNDKKGDKSQ